MNRFDFNWDRTDRRAAVLVEITLKARDGTDARTINVCHLDFLDTVDGSIWAPCMLDLSNIQFPGSLLTNDIQFANCTLKLDGLRRLPWMRAGDTIADLGSFYYWLGSRVQVFFIERDSFEAREMFSGVVASASIQPDEVELSLRARNSWNRSVTIDTASREKYPNCPEDSLGAPLAVKLGRKPGIRMRYPWPNPYSNRTTKLTDATDVSPYSIAKNGRVRVAGGKRADRGVIVDPGTSATNPAKIVLAPHKLARMNDVNNGAGIYIELDDGTLALLDLPVGNVNNVENEASFTLPDGSSLLWVGVSPSSVGASAFNPDTPQALLDPWSEGQFAHFNFPTSQDVLEVRFPTIAPAGTMTETYFMVACDLNGGDLAFRIFESSSTGHSGEGLLSAFTLPGDVGHPAWTQVLVQTGWGGGGLPVTPFDFSSIRVFFGNSNRYVAGSFVPPGGSGRPKLYACGFAIRCIPNQTIIESERTISPARLSITSQPRGSASIPLFGDGFLSVEPRKILPATTEVRGKLFANWEGYADDDGGGFGKYTGGAVGDCVVRPCDLARLVLQRWGKEPDSNIATGTSFGSFDAARAALKTWRGLDMELGLSIGETVNVQNALQWIMSGSASMITMGQDGTWRFFPVYAGMPTTYSRKISRDQLVGPIRATLGPDNRLLTAIRLPYASSDEDGSYTSEVQVAANKSSAGYDYFGMRHGAIVATLDTNDRFDVKVGASTATLQFTAGSYGYDTFLGECRNKFNNAGGHFLTRNWSYAFGGVTTQWNCKGIVQSTAGTFAFTVPNGVRTMEQHAAAVQAAMLAVSPGWIVAYNRTTRKFSINNTADHNTAYVDFGLNLSGSGATVNFSAGAGLGFAASLVHPLNGSAVVAPIEVDELRFVLTCDTTFDLLFRSGSNGFLSTLKRTAGPLLGFAIFDDRIGALGYSGQCPKFVVESALLDVVRRYVDPNSTDAARPDTTIDGRAVCQTDTAIEVVNRIVQVLGKAIVSLSIGVENATDLEIGHVFEFASDVDADSSYPDPETDGLWSGKRFLVVEFEQLPGPTSFHREVVAVAV